MERFYDFSTYILGDTLTGAPWSDFAGPSVSIQDVLGGRGIAPMGTNTGYKRDTSLDAVNGFAELDLTRAENSAAGASLVARWVPGAQYVEFTVDRFNWSLSLERNNGDSQFVSVPMLPAVRQDGRRIFLRLELYNRRIQGLVYDENRVLLQGITLFSSIEQTSGQFGFRPIRQNANWPIVISSFRSSNTPMDQRLIGQTVDTSNLLGTAAVVIASAPGVTTQFRFRADRAMTVQRLELGVLDNPGAFATVLRGQSLNALSTVQQWNFSKQGYSNSPYSWDLDVPLELAVNEFMVIEMSGFIGNWQGLMPVPGAGPVALPLALSPSLTYLGTTAANNANLPPIVGFYGLTHPPEIALSPDTATLTPGQVVSLIATRTNSIDPVNWSASGGTLTGSGLERTWTAPSAPGAYTVTVDIPGASDTAAITVLVERPVSRGLVTLNSRRRGGRTVRSSADGRSSKKGG